MISLSIDIKEFEEWGKHCAVIADDQMPFAMAGALNAAAFDTRSTLINDTWPNHVHAMNTSFLRASLRVVPADKTDLEVSIIDALGHVNLRRLETGGVKTPTQKAHLAVPVTGGPTRNAHGFHPKPLDVANAVIIDKGKGPAIYARTGSGKHKRFKLMYVLKSAVTISALVPFTADFNREMRSAVERYFPGVMVKAMLTRK